MILPGGRQERTWTLKKCLLLFAGYFLVQVIVGSVLLKVSQWQGGETFWYHLDGLGSTIAMTDESGKIRNRYGYDEYGNPTNATSEEIFNRFTFTGQAWDAGVGLYHYKARYYNPQGGRFLTQDTYKGSPWMPWTQNLYAYVGNNPVNMIDPTGHVAEWLKNIVKANPCSNPLGLCKDIASAVLGFVPIVGDVKDWMEVIVGRDLITGAKLTLGERVLTAAMGFVPFANGAAVRGGGKILMNSLEFERKFDIHIGKSNYRENLAKLTGIDPKGYQAHHIFPQKFRSQFEEVFDPAGLKIDDPRLMTWWESTSHNQASRGYNLEWQKFFDSFEEGSKPTVNQVLDYGKSLMNSYGFDIQTF